MNDFTLGVLTTAIGSVICQRIGEARSRATLIAPFITLGAFERLVSHLPDDVALSVFTRWDPDEIAMGVSDLRIFDVLHARENATLSLQEQLHAKLVVIDDSFAAIGSANITDRALGFSDSPNIEAMIEVRPVPTAVFLLVRHLERVSVPATAEIRDRMQREADGTAVIPRPRLSLGQIATQDSSIFPAFRIPERLHAGYRSVCSISDRESRAALLDDLLALSMPEGLSETDFHRTIAQKLLLRPEVAEFDEYVAQPRYFGEMAGWMGGRPELAKLNLDARKRHLQTLIRWLLFFLPERYKLDEPNYSERFSRVT